MQTACADSCSRQSTAARDSVSRVPAKYYAPADGLSGQQLKVALGQIISQHEVFAYGELWYRYEYTDVVIGTEHQVFDYYSPLVYNFTGTGAAPSVANKEHACPQSWWGKGAQCNAYTDLFNVMPSESNANSAKSNYPLGVVGGKPSYQNARMKVGASGRSQYEGNVFEPCDEFKGDFARLYFYVATTYADAPWGVQTAVAKTVAFTREDYPTIKPWILDLLLQWNAQDPVSDWEICRNERVCHEQHNRNPFIDYPQLADYIWGDKKTEPFRLAEAKINGDATSTGGGGYFPTDPSDNPVNPSDPTDEPLGGEDAIGKILLNDDFSGIQGGNDIENGGSSVAWMGNENFPATATAYEAGGAVRIGSSKKAGYIQSRPLGNAAGTSLIVLLQVKGWSSIEGTLQVSIDDQQRTVEYTRTMNDGYEAIELRFDHCPANAKLLIETSAKRAFVSAVRVGIAASGQQAMLDVHGDAARPLACSNLLGQPVPPFARGFQLFNGRKLLMR